MQHDIVVVAVSVIVCGEHRSDVVGVERATGREHETERRDRDTNERQSDRDTNRPMRDRATGREFERERERERA